MSEDTTQFGYDYDYDEDFDDDGSTDENSGHGVNNHNNNNHRNSDEEGRVLKERSNSLDTTDLDFVKPSNTSKHSNHNSNGKPSRTFDPYKPNKNTLSSRRAQSDPRGRKPPPRRQQDTTKGSSARSTTTAGSTTSHNEVMMNRVLSANRKKTATLHNTITELQQQCEELRVENKDLKRAVRIQDRDLRKYDGEEADLPMIMKRHNNEIKVLQDKLKKQKEMSTSLTENLRRGDAELLKTKDKLREFQQLAKEKNLGERMELKNKLLDLQYSLEEKDAKISELNRAILLQKKTQSRIVKEKNDKHAKALQKIKSLENEIAILRGDKPNSAIDSSKSEKQLVISQKNPSSNVEQKQLSGPERLMLMLTAEGEDVSSPVKIDTMVNMNERKNSTDNSSDVDGKNSTDNSSDVDGTFLTQGVVPKSMDHNGRDSKDSPWYLNDETPIKEKETHSSSDDDRNALKIKLEVETEQKENIEEEASESSSLSQSPPPSSSSTTNATEAIDETIKARKLLLAKLQAIDQGENPSEITENTFKSDEKKSKPKKPIFLLSAHDTDNQPANSKESTMNSTEKDSGSKPNSGNSRARRVDAMLNLDSNELQRRDSLESQKTDENLFQGVSSRSTYSPLTSNRSDESNNNNNFNNNINNNNNNNINNDFINNNIFNNNDNSNINFNNNNNDFNNNNKNFSVNSSIKHSTSNEDSLFGVDSSKPFEMSYSPSLNNTNNNNNNNNNNNSTKSKKGGFSLFDQFEDPFKISEPSSVPTTKEQDEGILKQRKTEKPDFFSKKSEPVDDLEEMFIL